MLSQIVQYDQSVHESNIAIFFGELPWNQWFETFWNGYEYSDVTDL